MRPRVLVSLVMRRPKGKPRSRSGDVGERTGNGDSGGDVDGERDESVCVVDIGEGWVDMTGKLQCVGAVRFLAVAFLLRTLTVVIALARTRCAVVAVIMEVGVVGEFGGIQGLIWSSGATGEELGRV